MTKKRYSRLWLVLISLTVSILACSTITGGGDDSNTNSSGEDLGNDLNIMWTTYHWPETTIDIQYPDSWGFAGTFECETISGYEENCIFLRSLNLDPETEPQGTTDFGLAGFLPFEIAEISADDVAYFEQEYGNINDSSSWQQFYAEEYFDFDSPITSGTISITTKKFPALKSVYAFGDDRSLTSLTYRMALVVAVYDQEVYVFLLFAEQSVWPGVEPIFDYMLNTMEID